jgi:hypothetical protein
MLRLARLHALIRFPLEWRYLVERHPVKSVLRWRWWRRRFQLAYAEELPILRQAVGR